MRWEMGERFMNAYRREITGTIFFFVVYVLVCHTAVWSLIFGIDTDSRILGFPVHYFTAIILGWFGVLAISIWWNIWADRLEVEITTSTPDETEAAGNAKSMVGERV